MRCCLPARIERLFLCLRAITSSLFPNTHEWPVESNHWRSILLSSPAPRAGLNRLRGFESLFASSSQQNQCIPLGYSLSSFFVRTALVLLWAEFSSCTKRLRHRGRRGVGTLIHGVVRFRQRKGRDFNIKLLGSLIDHLVGATH